MNAMRMTERPQLSTVVDTCRKCGGRIVLVGGHWAAVNGNRYCYTPAPCTPHAPGTDITPGTIIPQSPAMRLALNALDLAEDTLKEAADGFCADCGEDRKCPTHQANLHEAAQIKALRDKLALARGIDEVAALLAGTGRAA
jgi:hypothetical protein